MSKINELIQTLCPDGVEWKRLGDVCDITTGKLNANAAVVNGKYMFFTCDSESSHIDKYAFDTDAILISGNGSQVGHLHSYCGKFNAYQRTYVLDNFDRLVMKAYLYNYMNGYLRPYIMSNCRKGSVPYITLPMLQSFQIPIPHIAVQDEIVRILDEYTDLEAELEAKLSEEIELKQKQYEFYRDELLTFGDDVERKKLNDCCKNIGDGLHGTPVYDLISNYYFINGNNLKNKKIVIDEKTKRVNEESFIKYMLKLDSSTLLMSINGTIGNLAMYHGENVILGKSVAYMSVIDSVLRRDFLYYLLQTTHIKQSLFQNVTGGTIKNLGLAVIRNFKIPVPSLTEQERIVKILDKYDTYTRDMISTLNTELESRKKQYAYYRDQLLTFKRKE